MPIHAQGDEGFTSATHQDLGKRYFTVSFSRTKAIAFLLLGVVLSIILLAIYLGLDLRGKASASTMLLAFTLLMGCIFTPLIFLYGILTFFRSRVVVHVYERGVERVTQSESLVTPFKDATDCTLNYIRQGVVVKFAISLSDELQNISFGHGALLWQISMTEKIEAIALLVLQEIPSSVKVQGRHYLVKKI